MRKLKIKKKPIILGISVVIVLAITGTVFGLNGWFGGGGSIPSDTMTRGLVGYWNMEEGVGTTTADISGNNNKGIFVSAASSPQWARGKVGGALSFDGTDDYASAGTGIPMSTSAGTLEAWFKQRTLPSSGQPGIIGFYGPGAGHIGERLVMTSYSGDNNIYLEIGDGVNTQEINFGTTFALNTWYHVVVTYDGITVKSYTNGVRVNSVSQTRIPKFSDQYGFFMGKSDLDGGDKFNPVDVDEVRAYNRALSAEEIRYHYNRGGPIGYWKFDEGASTTAYDASGNANTGTLTNMSTTTSWVSGKYGSALNFDGVDDYLEIPHNNALSLSNSITLSANVYINSLSAAGRIIEKGNPGASPYSNYELLYLSTGAVRFSYINSGLTQWQYFDTTATPLQINTWYNITAVDSFGTPSAAHIYINGVEYAGTWTAGDGAAVVGTNTNSLYIGFTSVTMNGLIDDVRIYNYARTPDEIALDYNAGFAARFGGTQTEDLTGLVGWWTMDGQDVSGTTLIDKSNSKNNGTINGATVGVEGQIKGALNFDGTNDYVDFTGSPFASLTQGTIAVWFKSSVATGKLIEIYKVAPVDYFQFELENSKLHYGYVGVGGGGDTLGNTIVSLNVWNHAVLTQDSSGWKMYVNGKLDKSGSETVFISSIASPQVTEIGFRSSDSSRPFNGQMDDFRIYNRALSASEIKDIYNGRKFGPIAYWKFDEGASTTAYDASGNANTGTLTNMSTTTSWVSGKYGSALNFDGVDDYVNIPDSSTLDVSAELTISAWFKPTANGIIRSLISKGNSAGNRSWMMEIRQDETINVGINTAAGSIEFNVVGSGYEVANNSWNYLVYTYKGGIMTVYLNGKIKSFDTGYGSSAIINSSAPARIGDSFSGAGNRLNGLIDDVRIYNYARAPEEIRLDYNAGFAVRFGGTQTEDLTGLVGWWTMDGQDVSGTTIRDMSNNGNNGTIIGATVGVEGQIKGALSFITDDYISVPDDAFLTQQGAVSIWYKSTASGVLFASGKSNAATPYYYVGTSGGGFEIEGSPPNFTTGDLGAWDGNWHHLVLQSDGSTVTFWFDGIRRNLTVNVGSNTGQWYGDYLTDTFSIGVIDRAIDYGYFNGTIDEVRIYNRALSASEIKDLYNNKRPFGPIAYWKFDEGTGLTAYDFSGNANHGDLQNNMATTSWTAGKSGSALLFDGVNDYVKSTTTLSAIASSSSYSLWFKSANGIYPADQYLFTQGTNDPAVFIESTDNKVYIMAEAANRLSSSKTVNDTNWHHLEMVSNGASLKLYLDGVLESQTAYTQFSSSASNLYVASNATPGSYFSGLIDDVRIYNYARSPEQVLQDYNSGFSTYFK